MRRLTIYGFSAAPRSEPRPGQPGVLQTGDPQPGRRRGPTPPGDDALCNPAEFANREADDFQAVFDAYAAKLAPFRNASDQLLDEFQNVTRDWSSGARDALLSRYLGFPLWDGIVFPTISL